MRKFIICNNGEDVVSALHFIEAQYPQIEWVNGLGRPTEHYPQNILQFPIWLGIDYGELFWASKNDFFYNAIEIKIPSTVSYPSNLDLADFLK